MDDAQQVAATVVRLVEELCRELHPQRVSARTATLDSLLDRDLGIDSLGRAELFVRIERAFGIRLPEHLFAAAETPRDLMRAVCAAGQGAAAVIEQRAPALSAVGSVPENAETLIDVLDWHARKHAERPHIELYRDDAPGECITYGELHAGARTVAAGLQRRGLEPGAAVSLMLPTGRDYFLAFFGILMAGGIPVPIYPPARLQHIEDHLRRQHAILENCRATILITVPEARNIARLMRAQVDTLRTVATVDSLGECAGPYRAPAVGPEDIGFLQYTSGSTGTPKGVVLTHANLLANIRADGAGIEATGADVFVSWLPLYHDMGLIGAWLASLYHATMLVIMSPVAFLTGPQRWLQAIHRYRGTLSAAPNFANELCLNRIDDAALAGIDLSSWRITFNAAEPVSPDTLLRFCQRFEPYGFRRETMFPAFGLAECSLGLTFPPIGRPPLIDCIERGPFLHSGRAQPAREAGAETLRFVACGQPLPGHAIRIVDEDGRELPGRHQGRLQFRGPSATGGYYRNAAETRRLFEGDWVNTGDLAYIADGDLYVTGRTKDVIIRAGRNIHPHELEEGIGALPQVRKGRVAAFGCADPESGTEQLVILAEPRETDTARRDALCEEINALTVDLVGTPPDKVVLAPPNTVLKTSSGKIRRSACRTLYERGAIGRQHPVWWQVARLALTGMAGQWRRALRRAGVAGYQVYVRALVAVATPGVWLSVMVLPGKAARWAVVRASVRLLARVFGIRLRVEGMEHLPGNDRSCVLVANHASYIDAHSVVAALPLQLGFVAKEELAQRWYKRIPLRRIGTEFVDRFDQEKGIADVRRLARSGQTLLFFPEGAVSLTPGVRSFRMGAFLAAAQAKVPVIPIAIRGSRRVMPDGTRRVYPGTVTLVIGEPIAPAPDSDDAWNDALRLRDQTRRYIVEHCGEPDMGHETALY